MKPLYCVVALLIVATSVRSDDFKTTNGKQYKNATVTRVEPDGIVIKFSGGIVKLPFSDLPKEVQEKFHYDPEKAAAYSSAANSAIAQYNEAAQREAQQQKSLEDAKRKELSEHQTRQQNAQTLAETLAALNQQEENLLTQIGRAKNAQERARRRWISTWNQPQTAPEESNLPLLEGRLDNIRAEKKRVQRELDAQAR